jgi:PERQ amino acid-rich with GYF domain-containing protein
LPSTANWASSVSPVTPSTASSAWSKPAAKTTGTPAKTLAQIQKEEEARKQKLAQVNAVQAAATTAASPVSGKRYADLASKVAASPTSAASGAWTTVGAGGKTKAPPAAPVGPRSTSATLAVPQVAKPRPVAPVRTTTIATAPVSNANRATEEFTKWAKITLGKGLNNGINVDDFVQQLLFLPAEAEIISDSVYANSQTLDGRRFAEEFIRRRKLADKGIADPVSTSAFTDQKTASGGWSEVAKKSSSQPKQEDDSTAVFKVVAGKKKGKR